MNKKRIALIVGTIFIVSAVGGSMYVLQKKQSNVVVSPQGNEKPQATPTSAPLATWEDQNGFTFQYPKDLTVNKHDEDQVNYAHIELTHKNHPGSVIVWAKDTSAADAAAWVKGEKSFAAGTVLDTTIADNPGKKVLLSTPKKLVVSGIVDDGVVYYIEGNLDDTDFWTGVHNTITSSFAFVSEKPSASNDAGSGGEEAVDEEEVIE